MPTMAQSPAAPSPRALPREIVAVAAGILAIKLAWLAIDHTLRVYMGDSMVFLQAGAEFSSPAARSYPYGWALHFFAFPLHSNAAILIDHVLWSTLSGLGLYVLLRRHFEVGVGLAAAAALAFEMEPTQVFLERLVMAETLGLLALVATILLLAEYLRAGRLEWYLGSILTGLAAGALRTNFLPLVLGLGIAAPLLLMSMRAGWTLKRRSLSVVAAWSVMAVAHLAYTAAYGRAVHQPPGYVATSGMFRIGLVAPLIRPEHFKGTDVSGEILERVKLPLHDHWRRGEQIWANDGLWAQLTRESRDPEAVARTITSRAMRDDPIGLLRINLETLGGYFDNERAYWRMQDDIAVIPPDARAASLIRHWLGWDVHGVSQLDTPARTYFVHARWWLTFCLFALAPAALAALLAGWGTPRRAPYVLLALASLGLVATHLLFVHIVSYRYLHPLPWFMVANVVAIIGAKRRMAPAVADTRAS